jgi:hypothetical protein
LIIKPGLAGFLFVARYNVASPDVAGMVSPVFLLVRFLPTVERRGKCEKSARYTLKEE